MSEIDTKAAREVLATLTTDEWEAVDDGIYFQYFPTDGGPVESYCIVADLSPVTAKAIAFLRNNAPAWLDAIDRLTRELAEVRRELDALCEVLKRLRSQSRERGDTLRRFAELAGVTPTQMSEWTADAIDRPPDLVRSAQQRPTDQ